MTYQELKKANRELEMANSDLRDSRRKYKWLTALAIIYIRGVENQLLGNNKKVIEGFHQKAESFEKEMDNMSLEEHIEYNKFFNKMMNDVNSILNSIIFNKEDIEKKVRLIKNTVNNRKTKPQKRNMMVWKR